jgi:hypothetical protein
MKKSLVILGILFPSLLLGQAGDFFPKMPLKYEAPYPGMSTSVSNDRGENVWYVIAAKDNIPVYSDERFQNQKGTEKFLQSFVVWQETEDAVRLVKKRGTAAPTSNYRFTTNVIEVGWVKKQDLVLGMKNLSVDKVPVRALLKKTPDNRNLPSNMPGFNKQIADSAFDAYFVLKQEPETWLLSVTDLVHENLVRNDVFWVKKSNITTIITNRAYVPDWKKVQEGQKLYTFSDRNRTGNNDTTRAAFKIYKNNPRLGFFYVNDDQRTAKVMNPLAIAVDTQYINLSDARFLKANFIDNNQFTALKVFAKAISEAPLKELLRFELFRFFMERGIDTNNLKIRSMNVAEMLGYVLGVDFSGYSGLEVTPVNDIKEIDLESYYKTFGDNYDRLISEKEIDKFRFFSGISYCWLPQNLLSLDILSRMTLFKPNKIIIKGDTYREYSICYIDHSAPATEKTYEQLQAEIRRLYMNLNQVWTAENQSNDIGDYIYYSSGVDPLMGSGEPVFEQITGQMRNSATVRPDLYTDKLILENKLMSGVKVVTGKITIHFSVSDNFYQSELEGRAYFLKEFIERIHQMLATSETQILVNLYFNNPKNTARESELQSFCKKMNTVYPNVKYEVYKYSK